MIITDRASPPQRSPVKSNLNDPLRPHQHHTGLSKSYLTQKQRTLYNMNCPYYKISKCPNDGNPKSQKEDAELDLCDESLFP